MPAVATFHLASFPLRRSISKLITVPAERWELTDSDGCVMGRVLGTSKQGSTRGATISRWALFAVWESEDARSTFLEQSPIMKRWRDNAPSLSETLMTPIAARGTWKHEPILPDLTTPVVAEDQPIAVLTSASVRPSKLLTFQRASKAPDVELRSHAGCSFAIGIGEWPIAQLATFSIWDSVEAVRAYSSSATHSEVIKRRYKEKWYSEELFMRFSVESSTL